MVLFGAEATGGNPLNRPCGIITCVGGIGSPSQLTPPKAVMFRCAVDGEDAKAGVVVTDMFEPADATAIWTADIRSKYGDFAALRMAIR